jgi:hypothetical protein
MPDAPQFVPSSTTLAGVLVSPSAGVVLRNAEVNASVVALAMTNDRADLRMGGPASPWCVTALS